jgi:antitoxin (DNA-binding transcriptional repressor) of toxin-antitoxin stability system
MLAAQPVARLASVLQVRRISSPMTLAVWARINDSTRTTSTARTGKPILEQTLIDRPA